MKLLERRTVAGEPELLAALGNACDELAQVQLAAEIKVAAAQGEVTLAQGRLDEFRVGLVRENARKWRERAAVLRERVETVGDETVVERVVVLGGMGGGEVEPRLRFRSSVLFEQADQADVRAQHLEARLGVGDLAGESLELLVSQLEELPADVPEPVAV